MIQAEGIGVEGFGRWILRDLTFTLKPGDILGLIGSAGTGKSTALRVFAGLQPAGEGRAFIGDVEITRYPGWARRRVGYLPAHFGIYEDMSSEEHLHFWAACHGVARAQRRGVVNDLLELVDLSAHREARAGSLSRDMRQRLGLARCLVHDPDVLLLDEPSAGMDPRSRLEMRELLRELAGLGKTVVVATHALGDLPGFCSHVALLSHGRMIAFGSVDDILSRARRSKVLQVQVAGDGGHAVAVLRALPWIGAITRDGPNIQASYTGGQAVVPTILTHLLNQGVAVMAYGETAGRLEDAVALIVEGKVSG